MCPLQGTLFWGSLLLVSPSTRNAVSRRAWLLSRASSVGGPWWASLRRGIRDPPVCVFFGWLGVRRLMPSLSVLCHCVFHTFGLSGFVARVYVCFSGCFRVLSLSLYPPLFFFVCVSN